ncbi:hypothetical protein J4211_04680 [Candidatus Woesearchaeota archaeon]|nr:hypothetical protein [Candidatus Woesearchaeota archaeon]
MNPRTVEQYNGVIANTFITLRTIYHSPAKAPVQRVLEHLLVHEECIPLTLIAGGKTYYACGIPAFNERQTPSLCIHNDTISVRARTGLEVKAATYHFPLKEITSITTHRLPSDYHELMDDMAYAIDTALKPPKQIKVQVHKRISSAEQTFEELDAIKPGGTTGDQEDIRKQTRNSYKYSGQTSKKLQKV